VTGRRPRAETFDGVLDDLAGDVQFDDRQGFLEREKARVGGVIACHGLPRQPARGVIDHDVVARHLAGLARGHDPVDHVDQAQQLGFDPRLLDQFAQGGGLAGLAPFDAAARQAPLALARRVAALDQKDLAVT